MRRDPHFIALLYIFLLPIYTVFKMLKLFSAGRRILMLLLWGGNLAKKIPI